MTEKINHPPHYGGKENPYEAIKVIDAWGLDFSLGNAVKYISRAGKKDDEIQDLKKALWYLEHKIKLLESKNIPETKEVLFETDCTLTDDELISKVEQWLEKPFSEWSLCVPPQPNHDPDLLITELYERLRNSGNKPNIAWIDIRKTKPEKNQWLLVFVKETGNFITWYDGETFKDARGICRLCVTHWIKIPELNF